MALRAAMVMCAVLLCACARPSTEMEIAFATVAPTRLPVTPSTVPVTLYFRSDASGQSMLVPVEREIPRVGDPAERALELLIDGPVDGEALPAVPPGVVIEEFSVANETARVRLSGDLDGGSTREAAAGPRGNLLPLAAIANTLTEFPSITEVQLEAADLDAATAFAGWGIPNPLVRDETFLEPAGQMDPFSAMSVFSINPQQVGSPDAVDVPVAGVRVIDRLNYVRIVVELAEAPAGAGDMAIPQAHARLVGDELILTVSGVAPAEELPARHRGPGGPVTEVDVTADSHSLAVSVSGSGLEPQPFHLLTEHSPSRILLDVKK